MKTNTNACMTRTMYSHASACGWPKRTHSAIMTSLSYLASTMSYQKVRRALHTLELYHETHNICVGWKGGIVDTILKSVKLRSERLMNQSEIYCTVHADPSSRNRSNTRDRFITTSIRHLSSGGLVRIGIACRVAIQLTYTKVIRSYPIDNS
jgi:hypothetical protein